MVRKSTQAKKRPVRKRPTPPTPPLTVKDLRGATDDLEKGFDHLADAIHEALHVIKIQDIKGHRLALEEELGSWERGYDVGFKAGRAAGQHLDGAKATARAAEKAGLKPVVPLDGRTIG